MNIKRFALMIVILLAASTSHALDCEIVEGTAGFKDLKAFHIGRGAQIVTDTTGNDGVQRLAVMKLMAEGRVTTLDKGEKVTLIGVDQWDDIPLFLIRTKDKRELLIEGIDLKCKKQR